jgi:ferredoxin
VLAPDLFEVDELGLASARGDGAVSAGQEEAAQLAVDNCPEYAVAITDD